MQVLGSGILEQAFQRAWTSPHLTLALASRMVVSVLNQCPAVILVTEAGQSTDPSCSPSWLELRATSSRKPSVPRPATPSPGPRALGFIPPRWRCCSYSWPVVSPYQPAMTSLSHSP